MKPVVFMFSGQGSQYFHMGRYLMDTCEAFRSKMEELDAVATDILKVSVLSKLYDPRRTKSEPFSDLEYSHPAIFMVQYSICSWIMREQINPAAVLGVSLGEFVSSSIAGLIHPYDALRILIHQAHAIMETCVPGKLFVVISAPECFETIPIMFPQVEIAGVVNSSQFSIAVTERNSYDLELYLKSNKIIYQELPIQWPFHSANIEPARNTFLQRIKNIPFSSQKMPIYSSLTGGTVHQPSLDYFWKVARQQMLVREAIECASRQSNRIFIDMSPSGTMANIARAVFSRSKENNYSIFQVINPFSNFLINITDLRRSISSTL